MSTRHVFNAWLAGVVLGVALVLIFRPPQIVRCEPVVVIDSGANAGIWFDWSREVCR